MEEIPCEVEAEERAEAMAASAAAEADWSVLGGEAEAEAEAEQGAEQEAEEQQLAAAEAAFNRRLDLSLAAAELDTLEAEVEQRKAQVQTAAEAEAEAEAGGGAPFDGSVSFLQQQIQRSQQTRQLLGDPVVAVEPMLREMHPRRSESAAAGSPGDAGVGSLHGAETSAAAAAAAPSRSWTPSWLGLPSLETGPEGGTRATFFRLGSFGLQLEIDPLDGQEGAAYTRKPGAARHGAPPVAGPTPLPSAAELEEMTGKELKRFLQSHLRVSTAGCLDKADMLALAKAGRLRAVLGSSADLAAADTCQDV